MICKKNINDFYRGDSVPLKVSIKNADSTPIDISGSIFTITLKANETDIDPGALQKNGVITDALNGEALITLLPHETNIDPGQYFYDVQWKTSTGEVRTLINGTVKVLQDITQS